MIAQHRVFLSAAQRRACIRAANTAGESTRLGRRALILLHADLNAAKLPATDERVAVLAGVTTRTVARVRASFNQHGFDATLYGRSRGAERPSKLSPGQEAILLALLSMPPPLGYPRWTIRTLADELRQFSGMPRVSRELVRRTLNRHQVTPDRRSRLQQAEAS